MAQETECKHGLQKRSCAYCNPAKPETENQPRSRESSPAHRVDGLIIRDKSGRIKYIHGECFKSGAHMRVGSFAPGSPSSDDCCEECGGLLEKVQVAPVPAASKKTAEPATVRPIRVRVRKPRTPRQEKPRRVTSPEPVLATNEVLFVYNPCTGQGYHAHVACYQKYGRSPLVTKRFINPGPITCHFKCGPPYQRDQIR